MSRARAAALTLLAYATCAACEPPRAAEAPPGVDAPPAATPAPSSSPASLPDLSRCATGAAEGGPSIMLRVQVDENGHVQRVEDDGSTAGEAAFLCAQRVIEQLTFPPCNACSSYETRIAVRLSPHESAPPVAPPQGETADAGAQPDADRWL